jgi:hypothetical protein
VRSLFVSENGGAGAAGGEVREEGTSSSGGGGLKAKTTRHTLLFPCHAKSTCQSVA